MKEKLFIFFAFLSFARPAFAQGNEPGSLVTALQAFIGLFIVFLISVFFVLAIRDILRQKVSDIERLYWFFVVIFLIPPISIPIYFFINKNTMLGWTYVGFMCGLIVFHYFVVNIGYFIG
ncbi:MAG: hypothetical protein HY453_01875 [Parcubacteria group bacterium]|nr:hypothetical protein [Parcubacteria group bacterium]